MSSTSQLRCLFCKHSNLPDSSFCSVCDAQLDLQPCEQCGAVDNRAAKNCYKCGAEFAIAAESEFGAEPEPVSVGDSPISPAEKDTSVTRLMTTLPNLDSTHTASELQQIAARMPSKMGPTTTGSHRRWWYFGLPLLLFLIATSTYLMRIQPAKLPQQKQTTQPVPALSNATVPSTVAAQVQSAAKPIEIQSTPLVGTDRLHSLSSLEPTGARATLTKRSAPAATDETGTPQSSPPLKDCPQEVATLGLCNPEINKEKQANE